jgi:hypothetical protein
MANGHLGQLFPNLHSFTATAPYVRYFRPGADEEVTIVNYSSPHAFNFDNGAILGPCSPQRVSKLSCEREDIDSPAHAYSGEETRLIDVVPRFRGTNGMFEEAGRLRELWRDGQLHRVVVPFMVLELFAQDRGYDWVLNSPFRTIISTDRVLKTNAAHRFGMLRMP